jgi:hypothetical protein
MDSMNSDPRVAMSVVRAKSNADIRRAAEFRGAAKVRRERARVPMSATPRQPVTRVWRRWFRLTAAFRVQS